MDKEYIRPKWEEQGNEIVKRQCRMMYRVSTDWFLASTGNTLRHGLI
jgi:hypothetical protein